MKKVTILIKGMHCASCAANIEKSLSKVKGLKNIRVAFLMKKGYADCDDTVTAEDIKIAVKKTGYEATEVAFA